MFRSPPELRSGPKGQPVALSTDKTEPAKVQRSVSASPACSPSSPPPTSLSATTMPGNIDPALLDTCVADYFSKGDKFEMLVTKLSLAMKPVIEEAVKSALSDINQEMQELRGEVASLREKLLDRTDDLEQYQRRDNIRFFGIKETKGEDTDRVVINLCREKLNVELPIAAISRSHRVGKQLAPSADGRQRHRPIIVRFNSYRDRRMVFDAKKKLKGSGVTIREDLTSRRLEVFRRSVELHGVTNTWTLDGRVLWKKKDGTKGVAVLMSDLPST